MATLTKVSACAATTCAFNDNGCTAPAITVGGESGSATCATFITLDARGGLPVADGQVGACQRLECKHNTDLMCAIEAVDMIGDTAQCASYEVE